MRKMKMKKKMIEDTSFENKSDIIAQNNFQILAKTD